MSADLVEQAEGIAVAALDSLPDVLVIEVPGVPVPKGRPKFRSVHTKAGANFTTTYTPAKTRDYENLVKMAAGEVMMGRPPLTCPLELELELHLPIPASWSKRKQAAAACGAIRHTKKPDADNCLKSVKDALNEIVWKDDSQAVRIVLSKHYATTARAIVRIKKAFGESA